MGCCFSKKRVKHPVGSVDFPRRYKPENRDPPPPPSPEEEKVKEVLSETPSVKATVEPKPVANAVAVEEQEQEVFKVKASVTADAAVSDLGSCFSMATDERSEAASESSVATSSVVGPERSPGKPARRRPVSGELGLARRDRAAAAYGVRSRSCRASPSPPPRREPPRDRSVRRSPSPAAKRPPTEQHRAASPAASLPRKPPVPSRRASPHRAREGPPPPPASPPPRPEEDAVTVGGEDNDIVAEANAGVDDGKGHGDSDSDGEGDGGKESLENPLVSMECFIFL